MNTVILMGRLTRDPEVRYTANNTMATTFTLAVNRKFKKEETDFFNITTWGKTAEFVSKYFKKGLQVLVSGRLQNRSWEDDKGKHYATDIIAEEVEFADSKKQVSDDLPF